MPPPAARGLTAWVKEITLVPPNEKRKINYASILHAPGLSKVRRIYIPYILGCIRHTTLNRVSHENLIEDILFE